MLTDFDYEILDRRIKVLEAKLMQVEEFPQRWCFIKDDDCHWYLIPVSMSIVFNQMLSVGEQDCYTMFNNTFDEYRCDSPSNFTFEKPE